MTVAALVDPAVVQAAADGDRSAFARVVDTYRVAVCSIALSIVRDVPTSEDVAQDVFVAAWGRLGELRDARSLGPWLRQVARNRAHDVLRRRHREPLVDPELPDREATDDLDPAQAVLASEQRAIVEQALDELPTDAREILLLFHREGRSVRHVARLLDLSEVAVKKRLSRARARLRDDVLQRFGEAAVHTAPRAAFTAAVLAAITVGSPSVAGAAVGALAATGGKLTKAALGSAGIGAMLAVAGVVLGMRRHQRRARSKKERAALSRVTSVSIAHVTVSTLAVLPVARWAQDPLAMWAWYFAFVGGFGVIHFLWIPRVIAERLAAERREDPAAAARQRREWWGGFAGWLGGAIAGAIGTAAGLVMAG